MRTIETNLHKFEELTEGAKEKALEQLWDINVDLDWYDFTYEDAEKIGLKISEFDIDRRNYVIGMYRLTAKEKNHGYND